MQTIQEENKGLSIVIPVYNEEAGIEKVLEGIINTADTLCLEYEIIVINDGSTDRTLEKAGEYKNNNKIKILSHNFKKGYGASIKTGIAHSLFDKVLIIDGDGTYPVSAIPSLVKESSDSDMVVGARIGRDAKIPLTHKIAKYILNMIAKYLIKYKIPDLNSGLRVMNKNAVKRFIHMLPDGFSFTTTITLTMHINDYRIKYIPISYCKRIGRSKISPIYQAFNFFQLILRTVMYFDPLRIFAPLSLFFFTASFLFFIYRIIHGKGFSVFIIIMFISGIQFLTAGMLADLINKKIRQ